MVADRHAELARAAGLGRRTSRLGHRDAALQRPVPRSPGASATSSTSRTWRSGRPPSTGADYVLVNPLHAAEPVPPIEPSPYLPTSRRFANPLYLRVERIPEYATAPAEARARSTRCGRELGRAARRRRRHRPGRRPGRPSARRSRPSSRCRGRPAGEAAFARLPRARGPRPAELRHLVGARRPRTGRTSPTGRRSSGTPTRRRCRLRGASTRTRSTSSAGCSGCSTSSSTRPSRPRCAPGCRWGCCTTWPSGVNPARRRRLEPAGHVRPGHHRRGAAGPVQPERAGLEPAAVAPRPAGRDGVRAVPGDGVDDPAARRRHPGRPRDRAVPAVVDPGGRRPDRRAPTSATTTRR